LLKKECVYQGTWSIAIVCLTVSCDFFPVLSDLPSYTFHSGSDWSNKTCNLSLVLLPSSISMHVVPIHWKKKQHIRSGKWISTLCII